MSAAFRRSTSALNPPNERRANPTWEAPPEAPPPRASLSWWMNALRGRYVTVVIDAEAPGATQRSAAAAAASAFALASLAAAAVSLSFARCMN